VVAGLILAIGCAATRRESFERGSAANVLRCDVVESRSAGNDGVSSCRPSPLPPTCTDATQGKQCFPRDELRDQAAYELRCPDKATIAFQPLEPEWQTVSVEACGRRAIYQRQQTTERSHAWILTSQVGLEPARPGAPAAR
jgi:hypothetical protein